MNKNVLNISLILLMASTGSVFAQQGFGTNRPAKSAAVEIFSPNKGLLIPRVALQADNVAAPITSPETSLMVYNTTFSAANNLKQGFYYWNGTKWEPFTTATTDLNTTNVSLAVVAGELVLTDSDGHPVKVDVADLDKQQITSFSIGTDHKVTLTLERGGTKDIDLSAYFNSTKLKNGLNTTISGNGLSGTEYQVNVATASTSNLGVVQIGSGINVDTNGVISVPAAPGETTTTITNTITGHKIADYKNEANNTVAINETVTNLTQTAAGISYAKEDGTSASAKVVSANAGNLITTGTDFGALLTKSNVQDSQVKYEVINGLNTTASLDASSTADLQKYKVDVTFPTINGSETKLKDGTNTTVLGTGTAADQYQVNVATGNGTTLGVVREVALNPTVNVTNGELAVNLGNTVLSGEVTGPLNNNIVANDVIDAANLKTDAVVTNKIANANVTPIKIQPAATFAQTQVMVTDTGGVVKWVNQSTISPATTVSNTSPDNTLITTVNGVPSASVNLVKTVNLALSTDKKLTTTVNGVANTTPLDLSGIDTDEQNLTFTSATNKLSIERGNEVDLSKYDTKLVNGTNTTVNGNGSTTPYTVNVATATTAAVGVVKPGTGLNVATDGTLNVTVVDTNTDVQQLSLASNTLTLERGGSVNLTPYLDNTDNQTLTYDNSTKKLSIVRGNDVDLSALATDNNTITTVSANSTQSYVKVTPNPLNPGTANRDYAVGVDAAIAQVGSAAGTAGVVKPGKQFKVETDGHLTVKYAMPQFFYMPSILIDTSTINAPGSPDKTINLYTQYTGQFNVTTAAMRSTNAPAQIPVLPLATDLYYYVTYSDTASIQITGITDQGVMSYRVLANTNSLSFVNIVFVIK